MALDALKLVELYGRSKFRTWMTKYLPEDLLMFDQMRKNKAGDEAIRAQVVTTYNKIYNSKHKDEFKELITKHFPDAIVPDEQIEVPLVAKLMVPAGKDPNNIFSCYNPNLLRFPMQMIFTSTSSKELREAVKEFTNGRQHETVTIGDYAYVEYVLTRFAKLEIPDQNWEIKAYKASRKNKVR